MVATTARISTRSRGAPGHHAEVIRIHSEREYRVFVIGFVPGFAYLGTLDERLALPRRESPRKRVPPGSVAIAERQTGSLSVGDAGWMASDRHDRRRLFDPRAMSRRCFRSVTACDSSRQ